MPGIFRWKIAKADWIHRMTQGERGRSHVEAIKLLECFDGDREVLSQLSEVFLQEYAGQLAAVRSGLEASDMSAVMRSAHTVKGSAGVFGADAAVEAARCLEASAKKSHLTDARRLFEVLEGELTRLARTLETQTTLRSCQ